MSIIREVIVEELKRNQDMQSSYEKYIESLPKGSMFKRKVKDRYYFYLKFRENGVPKEKYLGVDGKVDIEHITNQIEKRKEYKVAIKSLKEEEKKLKRIIDIL